MLVYKNCRISYGGFMVVMPRVQVLTDKEFDCLNIDEFINKAEYRVPEEMKSDSFGWLDGKLVTIDYGN